MKTSREAIRAVCLVAGLSVASGAMAQTGGAGSGTSTTTSTSGGGSGASTTTSTSTSGGGSTSTTTSTGGGGSTGSASTSTHATGTHTASTTGGATTTTPPPPPEEEEDEGDGRDVDFLWIEAFGGVANVNLVAFSGGGVLDGTSTDPASGATSVFNETQGTGPMVGGALGFRVYWIAVGARTTFSSYNTFQIGTIGGEIALRLPIPVVEPYIRVGAGYAWQGDANYTVTTAGVSTQPATTVYGWAIDAALGVDIFLANWFTIGAGIGLDVLNMTRQTDPRGMCMGLTDFCPSRPGDAVGYQLSGFGQIGFHI